jgi:hypothetical protein
VNDQLEEAARFAEITARRTKANAAFTSKVKDRLLAARVKEVTVVACAEKAIQVLMNEDKRWDLSAAVIVQDALLLARHNGRYAIFEREGRKWAPMQLQEHLYPMTAFTLGTLDDTINFVARLLVRAGLAKRGR